MQESGWEIYGGDCGVLSSLLACILSAPVEPGAENLNLAVNALGGTLCLCSYTPVSEI